MPYAREIDRAVCEMRQTMHRVPRIRALKSVSARTDPVLIELATEIGDGRENAARGDVPLDLGNQSST